jgi:hypothetical protein
MAERTGGRSARNPSARFGPSRENQPAAHHALFEISGSKGIPECVVNRQSEAKF